MRLKKLHPALLSFLFCVAVSLPLGIFLCTPLKTISEVEKRTLTEAPKLDRSIHGALNYLGQFDRFYSDHFGLRDALIRLHSQVLLNVFNTSPSNLVIKGDDGWLFYATEGVIEDYYGQRQVDPVSLDNYASMLSDNRDWLASLGIHYLLAPAPNKIALYDAYAPARIRKHRGTSFYEQLFSTLQETSHFDNAINFSALFQQKKHEQQLYLKTDTHWNSDGALEAFNALIEFCNNKFSWKLDTIHPENLVHENVRAAGDLSLLLHQEKEMQEDADSVTIKHPCAPERNALYLDPAQPAKRFLQNGCAKKEHSAIVISDSFGNRLRPYFNETFKRVIYLKDVQFKDAKAIIQREHPDIVIEIWVARNLPRILPNPEITEEVSARQYAASHRIALRLDRSTALNTIADRHEAALKTTPEGILMTSSGTDPFFAVPFTSSGKQERYVVEVDIDSPAQTVFSLYFTTAENTKDFTPQQMTARPVRKGANHFFLRLPHPHVDGKIRIDPGTVPGTYLLRSMTVKAVPPLR